ncbi:hypothetical protein FH972_008056 [Carpinus fangiana]|uniref:Endoglucanase n=1 Tax=Carpinus fangiana TaxID=176857 RepID=A0A5N6QZ39_9ROSI|nr:hypothetical protein FH972_008056 [Carpinus fangiana]
MTMIKGTSLCLLFFSSFFVLETVHGNPNYKEALEKSLLFFEGQRSGKLPKSQKITWRSNSGLSDGQLANVDLTGGYYDAGDNVKFNFPMAYTTTMLSWSTLEYGKRMSSLGQLKSARAAIRWATDYLLKCATATPGRLYVGVGDPNADHKCWERPEDMDTVRTVYWVSSSKPGSEVAAETAAALAAASMVFRKVRFQDELLWGAAWLHRATNEDSYLTFLKSLGADDSTDIFGWDNKYAGARVLLARRALILKDKNAEPFIQQAENFICMILPDSPSSSTKYTPGENPLKMSYMVGYGPNFPKKIHHRGSSLPSVTSHPDTITCDGGFDPFLHSSNPNPNILTGAIVGGPNDNDGFPDDRTDYSHSEPTTYINAAIVGPLAYFVGSQST